MQKLQDRKNLKESIQQHSKEFLKKTTIIEQEGLNESIREKIDDSKSNKFADTLMQKLLENRYK